MERPNPRSDSGRTYDSRWAKGTNTLRVEGCAFCGMFCAANVESG